MNRVRKKKTFFRKFRKYKILNPASANVLTKAVIFNPICITIPNCTLTATHPIITMRAALNGMLNKFAKGFLQRRSVL